MKTEKQRLNEKITAKEVITYMESLRNDSQSGILSRFFKTGPGEYGEGDEFLGLRTPQTRETVKAISHDISIDEVPELLMSKWHEVRLCGLLLLVEQFRRLSTKNRLYDEESIGKRDDIVSMYLKYAERANNWDLVDLTAPKILGQWIMLPSHLEDKQSIIDRLAYSDNLWRQRMSMVCTWMTTDKGDPSWCLRYANIHLHHPHDLMHKAVGWMLREMGKKTSMDLLRDFLSQHVGHMPRTTLRYAIEKMDFEERQYWMNIPREK